MGNLSQYDFLVDGFTLIGIVFISASGHNRKKPPVHRLTGGKLAVKSAWKTLFLLNL